MSATNLRKTRPRPNQRGVAAVEFALVVIPFLIIVFGILEIARAMYLFNTLPEVTRRAARAAANISFNDGAALDLARKRAVFDEASGILPLGKPVTYENIRFDYLYLPSKSPALAPITSMPSCPAKNRLNCMADPNGASCIRAVQASICKEGQGGSTCTSISYQSLFPLIKLPLTLPTSITIVTAETLGYTAGDIPCP